MRLLDEKRKVVTKAQAKYRRRGDSPGKAARKAKRAGKMFEERVRAEMSASLAAEG